MEREEEGEGRERKEKRKRKPIVVAIKKKRTRKREREREEFPSAAVDEQQPRLEGEGTIEMGRRARLPWLYPHSGRGVKITNELSR